MELGNLKPNISWHSVTVWISLVLNNFIKNRLTEKSSDLSDIHLCCAVRGPKLVMGV